MKVMTVAVFFMFCVSFLTLGRCTAPAIDVQPPLRIARAAQVELLLLSGVIVGVEVVVRC